MSSRRISRWLMASFSFLLGPCFAQDLRTPFATDPNAPPEQRCHFWRETKVSRAEDEMARQKRRLCVQAIQQEQNGGNKDLLEQLSFAFNSCEFQEDTREISDARGRQKVFAVKPAHEFGIDELATIVRLLRSCERKTESQQLPNRDDAFADAIRWQSAVEAVFRLYAPAAAQAQAMKERQLQGGGQVATVSPPGDDDPTRDPDEPANGNWTDEVAPEMPSAKLVHVNTLQRPGRRPPFKLGDRIRTVGGLGCYRHGSDDYRCYKTFKGREGALILASRVTGGDQSWLDERCFIMVRARSPFCGFEVEFDLLGARPDHTGTIMIYETYEMKLTPSAKNPRQREQ